MPGGIYSVNADVTFYAQWKVATYTVTYDANGGTGAPASQTKIYNVALTLSTDIPTRQNYIFNSWNDSLNGSGTSYASGASYAANADLELYAQWRCPEKPTPNCSLNGGTVKIGTQTWMKENLNCEVEDSKCYGDDPANCAKYGRLYNWYTAMNIPTACQEIQAKHRGICPAGWHIPSDAEWTTLTDFVGGSSSAGTKLKAASGWNDDNEKSGNGTDEFGFSALPGGSGSSSGFEGVGKSGRWWSSVESGNYDYWYMNYSRADVGRGSYVKTTLYSVRCVQD
jgi:uncharacterized protein (TIGR02145 family)/uncharacterized repeat protein (TIGR02543 family)